MRRWRLIGIGSVAFALLSAIIIAYFVYLIEGPVPESKINTYFDSFWWAFSTVTKTGHGDVVPITNPGRIFAMVLMTISHICTIVLTAWAIIMLYKTALSKKRDAERKFPRL